jgi:hypothetical protein
MRIQSPPVFLAAIALGLIQSALSGANQPPPADDLSTLRQFLKQYLSLTPTPSSETSVAIASVDLNGDNKQEHVIYVRGRAWCGSGGCLALVLQQAKESYQVIGRITVARLPIRVLDSKNSGWRSIGVWVQGGGIKQGYEATLQFEHGKYPGNPTTLSARRATPNSHRGLVLLSEKSSFHRLD